MTRMVARAGDLEPGVIQAYEVGDEGATAAGRSRIPLLRSVGIGRSGARRIALANVEGEFLAIDDTCTHRGCSLGDGRLEGSVVRCACHGSRFDVRDGSVVGGPAELPVRGYSTSLVGDEVHVEL